MTPEPTAPPVDPGEPPGEPTAADADAAAHTGQLRLLLRRSHPGAPWRAELAIPGTSGRLAFPSLEALSQWLQRLDRPPPGLR